MSSSNFFSAAGSFQLQRYPGRKNEVLRAWNSADTLLIEAFLKLESSPGAILVVNDDYGALTVALGPIAVWTDSALSSIAIRGNLTRNHMPPAPIIPSTELPPDGPMAVVMKVPKSLPFFEYQLSTLGARIAPGTTVLAGGMDKHLSPRVPDLLETYIGPTQRHRGRLKSRIFTAVRDDRISEPSNPAAQYYCEALDHTLVSLANVFSRDKVDMGSSFLIEQLEKLPPAEHVIDLACGNGILGLVAKARGVGENLAFCDESALAIASARSNAMKLFPGDYGAMNFHQLDGLQAYDGLRADLILCNPPFHSNHTVQEFVGRRLLEQCADHLKGAGRLCLVANRHLNYLPTLKRGFARVEQLAQNSKFIIWLAHK